MADVFWHEIEKHTIKIELNAFLVILNDFDGIMILNCNEYELLNSSAATIHLDIAG